MSRFEDALNWLLIQEGGYVNDPHDKGGETNFGVTVRVWQEWCAANRLPVKPMRDLTVADVSPIYVNRYWLPSQAGDLPVPLDLIHFDCAVNCGVGTAAKLLQQALRVPVDGKLGPVTLGRAKASGEVECLRYLLERVWYYRKLAKVNPTQQKFLVGGWLHRLGELYEHIGGP